MTKQNLYWWIFASASIAVMAVAGMQGFYKALLANDVTFIGITVCVLYVIVTFSIGYGLLKGRRPGRFTNHMVEMIQCAGLLGTFTGISIALYYAVNLDINGPEFKIAVVHAVMTKLLTSICGFVGFMFLSTQIVLLDA